MRWPAGVMPGAEKIKSEIHNMAQVAQVPGDFWQG
jgi:hypothetical protein